MQLMNKTIFDDNDESAAVVAKVATKQVRLHLEVIDGWLYSTETSSSLSFNTMFVGYIAMLMIETRGTDSGSLQYVSNHGTDKKRNKGTHAAPYQLDAGCIFFLSKYWHCWSINLS